MQLLSSRYSAPMQNYRTTALAASALLLSFFPALASGGFGCEVADRNVKFEANAGMQRGGAGAFLNFKAELESLLKNTPPDFRKLEMKSDAISQHWIDGKDFKLRLYTERTEGPFGSVEFLIEAKLAEEGKYAGRYTLAIDNMESAQAPEAKTLKASGKVVCFVE
jgi:hypothetical protein